MAIQVSLTADGVGAVYTSSGTLTSQDLFDADARLRAELERNPGIRYLLVDHGAIPNESIDSDSLSQLAGNAGMALELIPEGLVAIVAPSDVLYGLSRMWEMTANHPRMHTHTARSFEEAAAWLEAELSQRGLPFDLAGDGRHARLGSRS